MTKSAIRDRMRGLRRALDPAARAADSARICERLLARNWSGPIAVYLATTDEIDLTDFIARTIERGVPLLSPRWNGHGYELAALNGAWPDRLVAGPHAIPEPPGDAPCTAASEVAVWIVPGLAFARDGGRLGYGGGWYDRMMLGSCGLKIGVGYGFQIVDGLPCESHDVRLDEIVTP